MRLTVLTENTTCRTDLQPEHGLSLYLETGSENILFDMGQSDAFARNAQILGIDLADVTLAVISHGHYDHGGGLARFLQCNHTAPVYLSPWAFDPHFNAAGKDIGLDPGLRDHPRLVRVDRRRQLGPGITLDPALPWGEVVDSGGMQRDRLGCPEDFRHELYLTIREGEKTILLSGCSHRGIGSIARHFRPDILVGGFHLMNVRQEEALDTVARTLLSLPTVYYTGHCTGESQFARLKRRMGRQLWALHTGMTVTL